MLFILHQQSINNQENNTKLFFILCRSIDNNLHSISIYLHHHYQLKSINSKLVLSYLLSSRTDKQLDSWTQEMLITKPIILGAIYLCTSWNTMQERPLMYLSRKVNICTESFVKKSMQKSSFICIWVMITNFPIHL